MTARLHNDMADLVKKKLAQIDGLLSELGRLLALPFEVWNGAMDSVRATERNFELLVETASDICNELILAEHLDIPDTYKGSFARLGRAKIIGSGTAELLAESAQVRNVLVHEYDFEEDYKKFYESTKRILPAYRDFVEAIRQYLIAHPTEEE